MAIRFDAAGEGLSRSANLPSATAFTLCGRFKIVGSGAGTNEYLFAIVDTGGTDSLVFYTRVGGAYGVQLYSPAAGAPVSAGSISTGQWYFGALSCAGTGATDAKARFAALGATTFSSASVPGVAFTPTALAFGDTLGHGQWANAAVADWKLFDRALTDAELLAEMYRLTPASTTNLNLWTPMVHNSVANAVKDFGGNGRDWTAVGTLTVEDGPPIGWGAPVLVVGQSAASGSTGTLAATEGADTATFDGTSAGISGTIAATESADTAAIAGMLLVTGTLSATEGADTASLAGAVAITGTLVATESADTASINAGTGVNGSLAAAESADTFAATGAVAVTGALSAAESADTAEVSGSVGSVGINGTFAATEAADTAEVTGTVPIIGTLAATEAADTALLNGGSGVFGSVAATEAADTAEMAGTVGAAAITGTLAATEAEDTASVSGTVPVLGSFDILEASDTFSAAGQILVTGTLAATESADTAIFSTLAQLAVSIAHTRRIGARTTIFSAGRLGARRTYFAGRRIGPRRIQGD